MSAIDQYIYTCLGVIECPTPYSFFGNADETEPVHVAIYRLRQDIPEGETDFQGDEGDILVGGGGGEAPAMRIKMPEAILWHTNWERYDKDYEDLMDVYSIYWTPDDAFKLCSGYEKLGWNPDEERIGSWLTEHVIGFLVKYYAGDYKEWIGQDRLDYDGSICRKLSDEEDKFWNWKKHRYGL